jgi:hypothetical protein
MLMLLRGVAAAVVAALALAVWTSATRADETLRLGLNGSASTMTLAGRANAEDDDTLLVGRFGGFRGGFGGFRGFGGFHSGFGGFRGGFGGFHSFHSGFGGFRGGFGGFRNFRGFGGFRGGWGGWGGGWGGGFCAPISVWSPSFGCDPGWSYSPISLDIDVQGTPLPRSDWRPSSPYIEPTPMPRAQPPDDGTYPYDGGPRNPVPMPKTDPPPSTTPQKGVPVPSEGRIVSLPGKPTAKYSYAAYGEQPGKVASDDTSLVKKVQK